MKIKMVTLMAGPLGVREAGKVYEVLEAEARALIAGKYAVAVEKPAPAAVQEPAAAKPEKAQDKRSKKVETAKMPTQGVEEAVKEEPKG